MNKYKAVKLNAIGFYSCATLLMLGCVLMTGLGQKVYGGAIAGVPDQNDACGDGSGGGSSGSGGGNGGSGNGGWSIDPNCKNCTGRGGGGGGAGNGGTGGSGSSCCPADSSGMTVWEVSEPYINVFLYDEPLGYQPGIGSRVSFKLAYKQRDDAFRTVSDELFNSGLDWNCSWLNYITAPIDEEFFFKATEFMAGGGQHDYELTSYYKEYYTHTTLQRTVDGGGNWTGYIKSYPDGAKDYYGFIPSETTYTNIVLLTAKVDRFGHATLFVYTDNGTRTLLMQVIDADGRTNTLSYANGAFPGHVTSVTDPFGRSCSLQYDGNGMLTNITDVIGLQSAFTYDPNNWVTNLHTPYGNTRFEHFDPGFAVSSGMIRGVRVTDAAGGTNVYMLTELIGDGTSTSLPDFPALPTLPDGVPSSAEGGDYSAYRDSFHWGPRQAAGLPADLTTLSLTDFKKGWMKHWLHDQNNYVLGTLDYSNSATTWGIGQTLSFEIAPSPDGSTYGQMTFYGYDGKYLVFKQGNDSQPSLVMRTLPDATTWFTWYQRNEWGRPTNVVDTYSSAYGVTPSTRTNVYFYSGADLVAHFGPNGNVEDGYTYDAYHQLVAYTNAVGDVTSYIYDTVGRLTSTHTPAGLTTINTYFTSGDYTNFIQKTVDLEIGRTNAYTYASDLVATHIDERGLATTNAYDALQRNTNSADARGSIARLYNRLDLAEITDRMSFTNAYGYDNVRRKTSQTDSLGRTIYFNYCTCGALDSVVDALGNYTYFFYDNAGRMLNVVYPDAYSVTNVFDSLGELVMTTDSAGISATNWFNNQGLICARYNSGGQVSGITFDIKDRPQDVLDANNMIVTNGYDAVSRLLARGYPDGGVETFGYLPAGMFAYTNQLNLTNFFGYDAGSRKIFETNANAEVIGYTYNPASDLLTLTDGKNQITTWIYDQYGRVTNKLDQAGASVFTYLYDGNNRLTNRWNAAASDTTRYRYDPVGNLTNVLYAVDPQVRLRYDGLNRLTNMVDAVGTTVCTYTPAGQMLTEDGPFASDTVTNSYWNRLRADMDLQQPTGVWTNAFGYDYSRRLWWVTTQAGEFDYNYLDSLPSLLVKKLLLPNTSYITNAYDGNARLLYTKLVKSNGTIVDAALYGYNVGNQRTTFTNAAGTRVNYAYDNIGQLKIAASSTSSENRGYAYDAAWNLNTLTNNGTPATFSVDGKNQLTTAAGAACSYDNGGNLTTKGSVNYTYDDENRLASVQTNGALAMTTFVYDGLGRLREQLFWTQIGSDTNGGGDDQSAAIGVGLESDVGVNPWNLTSGTWYVYDGKRVIQERDINNNPTVSYTRGSDLSGSLEGAGGIGGLLARTDNTQLPSTNAHAYYHADGNGNITYLETSAQTFGAVYRYDAFGNVLNNLGGSGGLGVVNTYRFSSKEWVPMANAYYYLYRFYDPSIQRWLNRDPIGERGGLNLYVLLLNSPLAFVDAFGHRNIPVTPLPPLPTPMDNCDPVQKKAIEDAKNKACDKINACTNPDCNQGELQKLKDLCKDKSKPNFKCAKSDDKQCNKDYGDGKRSCAYEDGDTITFCGSSFPPDGSSCGGIGGPQTLDCIIIHEMTHEVMGGGPPQDDANKMQKCMGCPQGAPHTPTK
jgi:RHS repeat-associated protein